MKGYEKWSKYDLGAIPWINTHARHPHRSVFVNDVLKNHQSVIEVGPGEMIEYASISSQKDVDYSIVDVSDLFLKNCQDKFPKVKTFCSPIEEFSLQKMHDIVYAASVIEHMKDVDLAVRNMISLAENFHFVMFKWAYGGKKLTPHYHLQRKYWTSVFNVNLVLDVVRKYGNIEYVDLIKKKNGNRIPFAEYHPKGEKHRNGDYLMIHGKSL